VNSHKSVQRHTWWWECVKSPGQEPVAVEIAHSSSQRGNPEPIQDRVEAMVASMRYVSASSTFLSMAAGLLEEFVPAGSAAGCFSRLVDPA
jgi:hypothetical protein